MAVLKTPTLHSKGEFHVRLPWTIQPGVVYECIAVRDFTDFIERGIDVYVQYYQAKGLTREDYEIDLAAGAHIVTLVSDLYPSIQLPDTYIENYPNQDHVPYSNVVLAVKIGPLADSVPLEAWAQDLIDVTSDRLGVNAQVATLLTPHTGFITTAEHEQLEQVRAAAITNRTTAHAENQQWKIDRQAYIDRIATLEQLLADNGLLPG